MSHVTLPEGHRLISLAEIDSTNAEAQRLASMGERGPLWLVADRQLSGRGRLGRTWVSESGNLFVTHLRPCAAPSRMLSQLSLVAALAVCDAAMPFASGRPLEIKWPNDVLLDRAKFCGILVEASGNGCAAIGIGVNLSHAPADAPYPVSFLGTVSPMSFLETLAHALDIRLTQWDDGQGFPATRLDWLARAKGVGQNINAGGRHGIFDGLADDGALILKAADGTRVVVHAGEVIFGDDQQRTLGKS